MSTTWLGRVLARGNAEPRWVRVVTDGHAPVGNSVVEEIVAPAGPQPFAALQPLDGGLRSALDDVTLAVPVCPSKILCVGRNYRAHAEEMGNEVPTEPLLFFKPPSALVASGQPIIRPAGYERVDMEAELVAVIGRRGRNIPIDRALQYVAGYTLGNDVSNRDLQRRDGQWARAKGFDGACPLGPWIETDLDTSALAVRSRVNGETKQDGNTRDMVFDVPFLVSYVSQAFTLLPGDVILTGTPAGVGIVDEGDRIEVEVEGIGVLPTVLRR
jgi:2-keto-4-pentenoate hydratase/2-oxohepta-3-ene-1,7-dioic acid hydratase in catechol pathway